MDAADVIVEVVSKHPKISRLCVLTTSPAPLLQERTNLSLEEERVIELARGMKKEHGLPFWDAVLLSCLQSKVLPVHILQAASFHNKSAQAVSWFCRDDLRPEQLRELSQRSRGQMIIISSLVELYDGSRAHIPMLDFHIPVSVKNLDLVDIVVRELSSGDGFVLESGRSYHFYGEWLLEEHELAKFLGRALQYAPIVDRAWVAHQLIESACRLRISGSDSRIVPYVVRRMTPRGEPSLILKSD